MKFVLALALICAIPFFSFSQAPTNSGNLYVDDLLAMVDSLRSDPAFQADLNELAEGLLSLTGMSPQSILHTPLPDFSLRDLKGNTITNEDLFGKIVFLHIWHPDYVACPELHAQLNELRKAYRHQEVCLPAGKAGLSKPRKTVFWVLTLTFAGRKKGLRT